MTNIPSFRALIDLWPSRDAMAADIGARASAVSKWGQRDSIPAEWWSSILTTEVATAHGVSAEMLTGLAARREEARV